MRKIVIIDYDAPEPMPESNANGHTVYMKVDHEQGDAMRYVRTAMRMRPDIIEIRCNANWNL